MIPRHLYVWFIISCLVASGSSHRILFISIFGSKSHKNAMAPLAEGLAKRGHAVTMVTGYPSTRKIPNLTDLAPREVVEFASHKADFFKNRVGGPLAMLAQFIPLVNRSCDLTLYQEDMRRLRGEKWDLIVINMLVNDCGLAFAHANGAPYVYLCPGGLLANVADNLGNPLSLSYVPSVITDFPVPMSFHQRLVSFILEYTFIAFRRFFVLPVAERFVTEEFGSDFPSLVDIEKNVSLTFVNTKPGVTRPRPLLPDIVEVGGMNCQPAKPLPKNIGDFVNGSGDAGVIYFSLGTVTVGSNMPPQYITPLLKAFSKLPQRVIWKWETERMKDASRNILLQKWLPQQDLLGDSRVKVFITHGGLLSTLEAAYHGVPVLGLPISADQKFNMASVVNDGAGLMLEWEDLTAENLLEAINKLMTDESIQERVHQRKLIFRDQPMSSVDTAVFWSEYVIRHKGAPHLKSVGRYLPWYQFYSVDVIAFIVLVVLVTVATALLVLKKCVSLCCNRKDNKRKKD